jgi:hypothetical protein
MPYEEAFVFPRDTRISHSSRGHDWKIDIRRNPENYKGHMGDAHFEWIKDSWFGSGIEPGPYGQAYKLIGTPVFYLFYKLDKR